MNRLVHLALPTVALTAPAFAVASSSPRSLSLHRESDGSVDAVSLRAADVAALRSGGAPLFLSPGDDALPALQTWIGAHRTLLGLEGNAGPPTPRELVPAARSRRISASSRRSSSREFRGRSLQKCAKPMSRVTAPGRAAWRLVAASRA
jgi:hypothetical protein